MYSQEFLDARRQDLLKLKSELEAEMAPIARYDTETDTFVPIQPDYDSGSPEDIGDAGDEAEDYQERMSRLADLNKTWNEANLALRKLDEGTYGKCEVGGEQIEEERLVAYPAARTCSEHTVE